jgi:predicted small secreted protein
MLVVTGLMLAGCNTVDGLGRDLGLVGDNVTRTAEAQKADAGMARRPRPTAPKFAQGQVATVIKPGTLRDAPSLDGNVVGYVSIGDTYYVFGEQNDWVQVGADQPVAWVFDKLITVAPPQASEPEAAAARLSGTAASEIRPASP